MLTKERTSKSRTLKYAAVALALIAVLVFCFASCGKATPVGIEYVNGTAKTEYNQGETFDCTGAQIKVTYDNGVVETKAVTIEMVGNAPLAIDVKNVNVTYSENGTTVVGYIPVTVKDPYSADKAAAVEGLYANAKVTANATDNGVKALVADYAAKINAAVTKDAINQAVANFETVLDTYLADKAAVLASLEAVDLSKVYDTRLQNVLSLKAAAAESIKAASNIDEAKGFLASFQTAVANALKDQEVYEGDGNDQGQIYDKIDILELIEWYEARVALLRGIVTDALNAVNAEDQITQIAYDEKIEDYDYVVARLSWWDKFINLTITLKNPTTGKLYVDEMKDEIDGLLKTPIDDLADLLAAGFKILPIEYAIEGGAYVDGKDVTKTELLDKITNSGKTGYADLARAEFGLAGMMKLVAEYGQNADGDNMIEVLCEAAYDRYEELNDLRAAARAAGADIVAQIETIAAMDPSAAGLDQLIKDVWDDIRTWGTTDPKDVVFSIDPEVDVNKFYNNLVCDKQFSDVVYSVELNDKGTWDKQTLGLWAGYVVSKDFVKTYFIPNLDKLIDSTMAQDAYEVKSLVIDEVIYSYDLSIDAEAEIKAVEDALLAFENTYGTENYKKYFEVEGVNEVYNKAKAARDKYEELKVMAGAANAAIKAYKDFLATAEQNNVVKPSHYDKPEGLLKIAYDKFYAFAMANKTSANVIYTDVIENSDASTVSGYRTFLKDSMDTYIVIKYKEQRKVQTHLILNKASTERLEKISLDEHVLRALITDCTTYYENLLNNSSDFEYVDSNNDDFADPTADCYNYDKNLKKNLDDMAEVANTIADAIKTAYLKGDALFITDPEDATKEIQIYPVVPTP